MEFSRFLDCLADDFASLRAVVEIDLSAAVPTCPGWSVTDLTRHVGQVYLHKTLCMREGAEPEPWPPAGLEDEEPLALLDRTYAGLRHEFATRAPRDHAGNWYTPDQTVGFWIRRMAQETVIHRIDAELGTRQAVAPVPADLAALGMEPRGRRHAWRRDSHGRRRGDSGAAQLHHRRDSIGSAGAPKV